VIVTHNLAQARWISDRTMFLYQGHLVEHGDTAQVFEEPAQQETAHYVAGRYGETPCLPGELASAPGRDDLRKRGGRGSRPWRPVPSGVA
jgi:ABC-type glutathione transport system ATPase component